jgi:hypothetical protein
MQIRITHEHLSQEVYAMPCMPVCAVVFDLRHGDLVAALYCVEQNIVRVSDGVLLIFISDWEI